MLPSGVTDLSLRNTKADSSDHIYSYVSHPGCKRTPHPFRTRRKGHALMLCGCDGYLLVAFLASESLLLLPRTPNFSSMQFGGGRSPPPAPGRASQYIPYLWPQFKGEHGIKGEQSCILGREQSEMHNLLSSAAHEQDTYRFRSLDIIMGPQWESCLRMATEVTEASKMKKLLP